MEFGLRLWDTDLGRGREHGLVAGGYKAIDSSGSRRAIAVWART